MTAGTVFLFRERVVGRVWNRVSACADAAAEGLRVALRQGRRTKASGGGHCGWPGVISLDHGRPCSRVQSAQRNFILLVPGLNLVAAGLETIAVTRDPQGQRLGDMLANTQVIEGFGARGFATSFQRARLDVQIGRQHEKQPVEVK